MHREVEQFVHEKTNGRYFDNVLEIGGRNVNGGVRDLIVYGDWHTIDIVAGPDVDEVADATTWQPKRSYDLILCLEVFEHTPKWSDILGTISRSTHDKSTIIITAACPPRIPHGASGEHGVPNGEYYGNVDVDAFITQLRWFWGNDAEISTLPRGDIRGYIRLTEELVYVPMRYQQEEDDEW